MDKSAIISDVESTEIELERVKDLLQLALEMFDNEAPQEPFDPKNDHIITSYICFGNRSNLLRSLVDTVFNDIRSMCQSLTKIIDEA